MSKKNVVPSAMSSILQLARHHGKPVPIYEYSTLNEKLNIQKRLVPNTSDVLTTAYVVIGNGGHVMTTGKNGRAKLTMKGYEPRWTALYNQTPFVLRPVDNDLSPEERKNYRLRRLEIHNNLPYVGYYAKKMDLSDTVPALELRTVGEDGITTAVPFSPTLDDLNPVPRPLQTGLPVTTSGEYIASTSKVRFRMSPAEVKEYVDAIKIIEGEDGYAVITEVATVSAVDRVVQGDFQGVQMGYTEAIYAQIASFFETAWFMDYQSDGIAMTVDVGNVEPLMTTQAI